MIRFTVNLQSESTDEAYGKKGLRHRPNFAAGLLIDVMFRFRLGFLESADRLALFPVGPNLNNDRVGKTWYFLALCFNFSKTVRDTTKVSLLLTTNRKLHML